MFGFIISKAGCRAASSALAIFLAALTVGAAGAGNGIAAGAEENPAVKSAEDNSTILTSVLAPRIRMAQSGDYLPPSNRDSYRDNGSQGYDQPRSITPQSRDSYGGSNNYGGGPHDAYRPRPHDAYTPPPPPSGGYGPGPSPGGYGYNGPPPPPMNGPPSEDGHTYSSNEILDAGHRFFGSVSKGLAKVVEHTFSSNGRPNGYILGEEAGGAIIAGLRYGEGTLYTKHMGIHKVYWQGPSIGYDWGGEGSKTLILVYNLTYPDQIYQRFAGVDGSAYLVGGVGVTFQKSGDVVLAPIRSGVGVRLGANVGYLKYTPYPTWNPF